MQRKRPIAALRDHLRPVRAVLSKLKKKLLGQKAVVSPENAPRWDHLAGGGAKKTIVIYKACEKEMRKEDFKVDRPDWFDKKKCFSSFYASALKSPDPIEIHVVFEGDIDGDFAAFIRSHQGIHFVHVSIGDMYKANRYCYRMAAAADFDFCYFLEDDYLHLEDGMTVLVEGMKKFGDGVVFTLYDHPDRYTRTDDITKDMESILIAPSSHWRTAEATTHTFAISKKTLMDNRDVFDTKAFYTDDRTLFRHLYTAKKVRLLSPIPGRATHVNKYFLSPMADWAGLNARMPSSPS